VSDQWIVPAEPKASAEDRARAAAQELADYNVNLARQILGPDAVQDDWTEAYLYTSYAEHSAATYAATVSTINQTLGLNIGLRDFVMEELIGRGASRVPLVNVSAQTQAAIMQALRDGTAQGVGVDALERLIRDYVTNGSSGASVSARALRIARTETMQAQARSQIETYRAEGAYTSLIAIDNRGGYDDADCSARDGQMFTFEEADAELDSEHPNGTLGFTPGTINENYDPGE
jgi:hypothetical protein